MSRKIHKNWSRLAKIGRKLGILKGEKWDDLHQYLRKDTNFSRGQKSILTKIQNEFEEQKGARHIRVPKLKKESKTHYKKRLHELKRQTGQEKTLTNSGLYLAIPKTSKEEGLKVNFSFKGGKVNTYFRKYKPGKDGVVKYQREYNLPLDREKLIGYMAKMGNKRGLKKYIGELVREGKEYFGMRKFKCKEQLVQMGHGAYRGVSERGGQETDIHNIDGFVNKIFKAMMQYFDDNNKYAFTHLILICMEERILV